MAVTKSVSIREDQNAWLDRNSISLSDLVQKAIDERMAQQK
jgi:hypothetical protein